MTKLQAVDLSYFRGKIYFEDDGTQNYLVFQKVLSLFLHLIIVLLLLQATLVLKQECNLLEVV